jgi:hypothetical protein
MSTHARTNVHTHTHVPSPSPHIHVHTRVQARFGPRRRSRSLFSPAAQPRPAAAPRRNAGPSGAAAATASRTHTLWKTPRSGSRRAKVLIRPARLAANLRSSSTAPRWARGSGGAARRGGCIAARTRAPGRAARTGRCSQRTRVQGGAGRGGAWAEAGYWDGPGVREKGAASWAAHGCGGTIGGLSSGGTVQWIKSSRIARARMRTSQSVPRPTQCRWAGWAYSTEATSSGTPRCGRGRRDAPPLQHTRSACYFFGF